MLRIAFLFISNAGATLISASSSTSSSSSSSINTAEVGKIFSGSFAVETHTDTFCESSQPLVQGTVLGKCVPSDIGGASWVYDWCGWNGDKSQLLVNVVHYSSTNDCTGTIESNITTPYTSLINGCSSSGLQRYKCGSSVSWQDYKSPQHIETYSNVACEGSEVEWSIASYSKCYGSDGCEKSIPTSTRATRSKCDDPDDDDECFHVDSKINYKGVEYTYQELKDGKEPECTVPHSPRSRGVVISTSCDKTVRVTDTHLLATTKGFRLAYSLKPGDVMYGDYDKELCTVKSVEKEKETQQYFGLNCVHSEVLASGLRASTFGDFHTLPSWYMTYVGGIVGTEAAGSLGEYIAEWINQ